MAFPDSNTILDTFQSANFNSEDIQECQCNFTDLQLRRSSGTDRKRGAGGAFLECVNGVFQTFFSFLYFGVCD